MIHSEISSFITHPSSFPRRILRTIEPLHVVAPARLGHGDGGVDPFTRLRSGSEDAVASLPHDGSALGNEEEEVGLVGIDRLLEFASQADDLRAGIFLAQIGEEMIGLGIRIADEVQLLGVGLARVPDAVLRSEEHTSELQSRFGISYAVFCLKQKKNLHESER